LRQHDDTVLTIYQRFNKVATVFTNVALVSDFAQRKAEQIRKHREKMSVYAYGRDERERTQREQQQQQPQDNAYQQQNNAYRQQERNVYRPNENGTQRIFDRGLGAHDKMI
jgi:hypothetical protein